MANNNDLTPSYLEADFQTMKERLKTLLSNTETFKDYDFEGANITITMELLSYLADLNTYYVNKLAQNIHPETANVYEVVHSHARHQGADPVGYVAADLTVKVRVNKDDGPISYWKTGDNLVIPEWFSIDTGLVSDDGDSIIYCLVEDFIYQITSEDNLRGYCEFEVNFKQGEPLQEPLVYTYDDIISNQINLPFENWDMGSYPYSETQSSIRVMVGVNEDVWQRLDDFYDEISGLYDKKEAYMLQYNKYQKYVLVFSETRSVPNVSQEIKVLAIRTLGLDGMVTIGAINSSNKPITDTILGVSDIPFLKNTTEDRVIEPHMYDVTNEYASVGGSNPQDIEDIKLSGLAAAHSQGRNVTKFDYRYNLEERSDVSKANVWGEHEENPGKLDVSNYNRAYISLTPTEWDSMLYDNNATPDTARNVTLTERDVDVAFSGNNNQEKLFFPVAYNKPWTDAISTSMEKYKMLSILETYVLPELVYLRFDIGLSVKRTYNYVAVRNDVQSKLEYYFSTRNRSFGEIIDFREIHDYIIDPTITSDDNEWKEVRGIKHLVIRDLLTYRDIESSGDLDKDTCVELGYYWEGGGFEGTLQDIKLPEAGSLSSVSFTSGVNEDTYLLSPAFVGDGIYGGPNVIRKWDSTTNIFSPNGTDEITIDSDSSSVGADHVRIGAVDYIALGQHTRHDGSPGPIDNREFISSFPTADYNVDTKIYSFINEQPKLVQSIPTIGCFRPQFVKNVENNGSVDVEVIYLFLPNYRGKLPGATVDTWKHDSVIYKWNGVDAFEWFQDIPTKGGTHGEFFHIGSELHLVVVNHYDPDLAVDERYNAGADHYVFDGTTFNKKSYKIPTLGSSVAKYFEMDDNHYLFINSTKSNTTTYLNNSVIYKWNGSIFREFQKIPTKDARDLEYFEVGSSKYIAISNFRTSSTGEYLKEGNVSIMKWNGMLFKEDNVLDYGGVFDIEPITIDNKFYMYLSRPHDGTTWNNIDSKLIEWSGESCSFDPKQGQLYTNDRETCETIGATWTDHEIIQSSEWVRGHGTLGSTSFVINNVHYDVSSSFKGDTQMVNPITLRKWNPITLGFQTQQIININAVTTDVQYIFIDGKHYLVICAYTDGVGSTDVDSELWKWNDRDAFEFHQTLDTGAAGVFSATPFYTRGNWHLVLTCQYAVVGGIVNHEVPSYLYSWTGGSNPMFVKSYEMDTVSATKGVHMVLGGEDYIFITQSLDADALPNTQNLLFRYYENNPSNERLVVHQEIPSKGCVYASHSNINGEDYLYVASTTNGINVDLDSIIYKWDGSNFIPYQSIPTLGATFGEFFVSAGRYWLIISNANDRENEEANPEGYVAFYVWNGTRFEETDRIQGGGNHTVEFETLPKGVDGDEGLFILIYGFLDGTSYDTAVSRKFEWIHEGCSLQGVTPSMWIYPDNILGYYPHTIDTNVGTEFDDIHNTIKPIQLGPNQFPVLAAKFCNYVREV